MANAAASTPAAQPVRVGDSRRDAALGLLRRRETPSQAAVQAAGYATLEDAARAVASFLKLAYLDLDGVELDPALAALVPRERAERHRIVPAFAASGEVTIATCDPTRIELIDWLRRELQREVVLVVSGPEQVERAIRRLYDGITPAVPVLIPEDEPTAAALVEATQIIDRIFSRAVELRASDIHLEVNERETVVRLRVDGALRAVEARPRAGHLALVSRMKVLAQLDISERQIPQDGRIKLKRPSGDVDLRVSVLPTFWGEKVVCRILDNTRAAQPLDQLGFPEAQLGHFRRMLRSSYGLLLVTGPTGSGKSTTLYAAINAIRSPELNIVSVEDPVEYQLPGMNQVQVNPRRGLTFPLALRAILRQDPNVVLVGEIRDQETGLIATEAAMTGHLVLASLHTNDAASAVARLSEMGIDRHLLAPALVGVIAQRLVRRLCKGCSDPYEPDVAERTLLQLPELPAGTTFFSGRGCELCLGSGYKGRAAIRELLEFTPELRAAVGRGANADELRSEAVRAGMKTLRFEALRLLFAGETSAAEVVRASRC